MSEQASQDESATVADSSGDVHTVTLPDGRTVLLVGTAHISRESVDLVREVIERERPDLVVVELDPRRFEALSDPNHFANLDLREVLRRRQLAALIANLLLVSYQRRLGAKLGVIPGSELLEAVKAASDNGIPYELGDRDVRVTLRRAWHAVSFWKKSVLIANLAGSAFDDTAISEEDLRKLRKRDVISDLMRELGEAMPALKRVLIDERDAYLAQRIRETRGKKIVAVVGAGHVDGMERALRGEDPVDLADLSTIPPTRAWVKWAGWSVPATIVGAIAWIGLEKGLGAAGDNALYWVLAHGIPSAIGGAIALGHPLTLAAAFLSAPFTSLTPLIGAGHATALVQAWVRPPMVHEFQTVGEDLGTLRGWWRSRLLRVFLVFILTSVGSIVGTWIAGVEILSNL